jgi:hypothetical protein
MIQHVRNLPEVCRKKRIWNRRIDSFGEFGSQRMLVWEAGCVEIGVQEAGCVEIGGRFGALYVEIGVARRRNKPRYTKVEASSGRSVLGLQNW